MQKGSFHEEGQYALRYVNKASCEADVEHCVREAIGIYKSLIEGQSLSPAQQRY